MKTFYILVLSAALAVSAHAWADAGGDRAQSLGAVDGVLSFCTKVHPSDRHEYKELRKSLTGAKSDRELDSMERTDTYRRAFTTLQEVLQGAPQDWAAQACLTAIGTGK
jgi:hypothetical protein